MKLNDIIKPVYFWDIHIPEDIGKISRRLIIERVFSFGNLEEINFLISFYSREVILNELSKINYLDPKTLNFVSKVFKKPKNRFICYRRKRLMPQYWNS
jgi:hypothetical protein